MPEEKSRSRLVSAKLDDASIGRAPPDVEHERAVALYDLIEDNSFRLVEQQDGPYRLVLSMIESRLVFDIRDEADGPIVAHILSIGPFRKIVKDYFLICDSYYEAIKSGSPSRIEAIDMGRRGVHNEGSKLLQDRLAGKIETDLNTARRLFTLVCALLWRG